MQNPIPTKLLDMVAQAALLAKGADEHGATVNLGQNTAANIRLDMNGVTDSLATFGLASDELDKREEALRAVRQEARNFLMVARDSFKSSLGFRYNRNWDSTGLNRSLLVPRNEVQIMSLLKSFQNYMTNHPTFENEGKDITAAAMGSAYTALETAIAAVNSQETVVENAMLARDNKVKALRIRIRGTINALKQSLDPLDARWEAFGLNKPGAKARPDQPGKLATVVSTSDKIVVRWERVPRAEYYRVWVKVDGVDTEFKPVGSPADLDFTITGLPAQTKVFIAVSAVNNGGESERSEVAEVTTA